MKQSTVGLAVLITLIGLAQADADLIKELDFNVDGALPSADPDIGFHQYVNESAYFSQAGGFLQQRTFGIGLPGNYGSPNWLETGGSLDSSFATIFETRLRVLQIDGTAGAFFRASDGENHYSASFSSTGISIRTPSGSDFVAIADLSLFHEYRLESPGNSDTVRLFVDDALVLTTTAFADTSLNGFSWGDGSTPAPNGADVDWDYIRVSQVVPEPSPFLFWSILGTLAITAGWWRRERAS